MRAKPVPAPASGTWVDALLTSGSEALLGAVRNYLGPVKTPYDKRDLARRLEAFLRRVETQESIVALLDALDARIIGSSLLLGPVPEHELKELFAGELPLFELGVRVSNLLDRLILFRYPLGQRRLIAVNPVMQARLAAAVLDAELLFGAGPDAAADPASEAGGASCDAAMTVAFFCFLFHAPGSLRKGGGLTKRAAERAAVLFPALAAASGDRLHALTRALGTAGALRPTGGPETEGRSADREAFASLLARWGEELPFLLAATLSEDGDEAEVRSPDDQAGGVSERAERLAGLVAGAFAAAPPGLAFSRQGLVRWLRISARRAGLASDPAPVLGALESLGIVAARGEGVAIVPPPARASIEPDDSSAAGGAARARRVLVAEGAHALHLLPEASLEERFLVGGLARPEVVGRVWSFEVERDTARRAFAAGWGAAALRERLESMAADPLPQSLAFSLGAWEEEYRSVRLYRGLVLVADERQRLVIERSAALGSLVAESLAPGVYFLSAADPDAAGAELARAGIDVPAEAVRLPGRNAKMDSGAPRPPAARVRPEGADAWAGGGEAESRGALPASALAREGSRPDPAPRIAALLAVLERSARGPDERRELAERLDRRLVLTERQIEESDPRPERLEAGGLDYLGKVRVVERALRSPGDRLEVLYRLPGAEPVRAVFRPLRLDKNEKGLVLEAEDLGTGGSARVPLGAVSTVRRLRASLFGEDQ